MTSNTIIQIAKRHISCHIFQANFSLLSQQLMKLLTVDPINNILNTLHSFVLAFVAHNETRFVLLFASFHFHTRFSKERKSSWKRIILRWWYSISLILSRFLFFIFFILFLLLIHFFLPVLFIRLSCSLLTHSRPCFHFLPLCPSQLPSHSCYRCVSPFYQSPFLTSLALCLPLFILLTHIYSIGLHKIQCVYLLHKTYLSAMTSVHCYDIVLDFVQNGDKCTSWWFWH